MLARLLFVGMLAPQKGGIPVARRLKKLYVENFVL
jgi:hypothetical protein